MPSGLRADTDAWWKDYEGAKEVADEILHSIQERNLKHPKGGPDASRITAGARRKLGTLNTKLDGLADLLDSPQCEAVSENEKNRRRDLITALRNRREQMLLSLKRDQRQSDRQSLLDTGGSASNGPARETVNTADLDNPGLLQMQQQVMHNQDAELEQMEKSVQSTRHLALTINEELSLQENLLEDFEQDVDVTHNKMRAAQKRLKGILRNSGDCKCMLMAICLIAILLVVVIVGFKLIKLAV
jgi:SYP5 family syntaxin